MMGLERRTTGTPHYSSLANSVHMYVDMHVHTSKNTHERRTERVSQSHA